MITAVEIENFKGIRERTRIEIKPITLLFGPNSAGKSTLLHALQLAREIFTRRNLDVDVTDGGAGFIDLGGFRNYVHGRDATKAVTLRFDLDLSSTDFLKAYPISEHLIPLPGAPGEEFDVSTVGDEVQTGWVEVKVAWWPSLDRAIVEEYSVGLNGQLLASICVPRDVLDIVAVGECNLFHPLLHFPNDATLEEAGAFGLLDYLEPGFLSHTEYRYVRGDPVTAGELETAATGEQVVFIDGSGFPRDRSYRRVHIFDSSTKFQYAMVLSHRQGATSVRPHSLNFTGSQEQAQPAIASLAKHMATERQENERDSTPSFTLVGQDDALPDLITGLRLKLPLPPETEGEPEDSTENMAGKLLCRLLLVPARVLRDALNELRYVGPVRDTVPRNFEPPRFPDPRRWAGGLAAWDELVRNPANLTSGVSEWLSGAERLNTGYELTVEKYRVLPTDHPLTNLLETGRVIDELGADVVRRLLSELPMRSRIVLLLTGTEKTMHPADVGQGITQAVPVIVAALHPFESGAKLRGGLVAIEQPELHLNPRQQAALGDVFLASALQSHRSRFILETHSEHLILRLQRRIREATVRRKKTPPNNGEQKSTDDSPPPEERAPSDDPLKKDVRDIDIGVYYVRSTEGRTLFEAMPLDMNGDFVIPWPDDFFEIDFHERFGE